LPDQAAKKVGLKQMLSTKLVADFFELRNAERLNQLV